MKSSWLNQSVAVLEVLQNRDLDRAAVVNVLGWFVGAGAVHTSLDASFVIVWCSFAILTLQWLGILFSKQCFIEITPRSCTTKIGRQYRVDVF